MILLGNQSLVRVSTFRNKLKNTFSRNLFFSLHPPPFFLFLCLRLLYLSTLRMYVYGTLLCMYLKYLLLLFRNCSIIFLCYLEYTL